MTTAERIAALLTPELFRAWLEEKPGNDVVGFAQVSHDCPVARYLTHQSGLSVRVGGDGIRSHPDEGYLVDYPTEWPLRFIYLVDHAGNMAVHREAALIALDRALVLEEAP
jgi:hypothetical protein